MLGYIPHRRSCQSPVSTKTKIDLLQTTQESHDGPEVLI